MHRLDRQSVRCRRELRVIFGLHHRQRVEMARSASALQLVQRIMTAFDDVVLGRSVRVGRGVRRPRFRDGEVAMIRDASRVHRV